MAHADTPDRFAVGNMEITQPGPVGHVHDSTHVPESARRLEFSDESPQKRRRIDLDQANGHIEEGRRDKAIECALTARNSGADDSDIAARFKLHVDLLWKVWDGCGENKKKITVYHLFLAKLYTQREEWSFVCATASHVIKNCKDDPCSVIQARKCRAQAFVAFCSEASDNSNAEKYLERAKIDFEAFSLSDPEYARLHGEIERISKKFETRPADSSDEDVGDCASDSDDSQPKRGSHPTHKLKTLWKKVVESSVYQKQPTESDYDAFEKAVPEWQVDDSAYENEGGGTCTCTHSPITHRFWIENKNNKKRLVIGIVCIKKFSGLENCPEAISSLNRLQHRSQKRRPNAALLRLAFSAQIISEDDFHFGRGMLKKQYAKRAPDVVKREAAIRKAITDAYGNTRSCKSDDESAGLTADETADESAEEDDDEITDESADESVGKTDDEFTNENIDVSSDDFADQ